MQSGERPAATSPSLYWRKCTTCKAHIGFGKKYWICSVSTCNRQRTGLVFCDIRCFDAHVPVLNHRDAGAFERIAPTAAAVAQSTVTVAPNANTVASVRSAAAAVPGTTRLVDVGNTPKVGPLSPSSNVKGSQGNEILVVVSKVKDYIRATSGMNTSDSVMNTLSAFVRKYSDRAIESAAQNGRKTVLDRDF